MSENETQWHLSKSFNVSFIFAVGMQTLALAWFMAGLDNRTKQNAVDLARHDTRIAAVEATAQQQAVMLARIDENLVAIKNMIERSLAK